MRWLACALLGISQVSEYCHLNVGGVPFGSCAVHRITRVAPLDLSGNAQILRREDPIPTGIVSIALRAVIDLVHPDGKTDLAIKNRARLWMQKAKVL